MVARRRQYHRALDVSPHLISIFFNAHETSVGHNVVLAHAHTVASYNKNFCAKQSGQIGITLDAVWCMPWGDAPESAYARLNCSTGANILQM